MKRDEKPQPTEKPPLSAKMKPRPPLKDKADLRELLRKQSKTEQIKES